MRAERVQAFSDGVFAILLTILVLEFVVPDYQEGHLFEAILGQWPIMFAYVLTFTYMGVVWLFHHDLFASVKTTSIWLNSLNLVLIFVCSLLNYATSLLSTAIATGNGTDMAAAFGIYDVNAMAISAAFMVLYFYLHRHPKLYSSPVFDGYFGWMSRSAGISVLIYALALAANFWSIQLGAALLIGGVIFHALAYAGSAHSYRRSRRKVLREARRQALKDAPGPESEPGPQSAPPP
ncbi:Hypothetical membrane protein, DUF1211 family [Propionibacterium freudenreichii]|nr:Hypothetical membrane protein, DUF1211 family [Propionibacterium freudenreichii]SCQ66721.1 Hypothetical membrane protein, DUF1211 family [Propionibacterium freudenreichii]